MALAGARAGATLFLLAAVATLSDAPSPGPLILRLSLAKERWKAGEYLWYRLEAHNTSRKPMQLRDPFWLDQREHEGNLQRRRGVFLDVRREDGLSARWGAEPLPGDPFWSNDISNYVHPEILGRWQRHYLDLKPRLPKWLFRPVFGWIYPWIAKGAVGVVELPPGGSFTATPSRFRQGDWPASGIPRILWGTNAAQFVPPTRPPDGFRIMAGRWLAPGRYTVRAVLDQSPVLPAASADEEIELLNRMWHEGEASPEWIDFEIAAIHRQWAAKTPAELAALDDERRRIKDRYGPTLRIESNAVAFEVVP